MLGCIVSNCGTQATVRTVRYTETPGLPADVLARLNALRTSLIREINRQINGIIRDGGADTPRRNTLVIRETFWQVAVPPWARLLFRSNS